MDDVFYADAAAIAQDNFAHYGQPLVLTRKGVGTHYDPDTSKVVPGPDQNFNASGFPVAYSAGEIRGTEIANGDVKLYITPDLGTEPKSEDVITFTRDGSKYRVILNSTFKPGGFVVFHQTQARLIA